jgi:hypothetical protein
MSPARRQDATHSLEEDGNEGKSLNPEVQSGGRKALPEVGDRHVVNRALFVSSRGELWVRN